MSTGWPFSTVMADGSFEPAGCVGISFCIDGLIVVFLEGYVHGQIRSG
jgi:hypothetical protein